MRVIGTDVNTFLPQIAIQRLDIVTDGAAALYGSQAVASVVNFAPISSFDGVKLEYYQQGDVHGDYKDSQISFLSGTEWNGSKVRCSLCSAGSPYFKSERRHVLYCAFTWSTECS